MGSTNGSKRAAKGGELGANGEWYEGGKFINTIPENAKKEGSTGRKAKVRKVQVGPYEWAVQPTPGATPIYVGAIGGVFADKFGRSRPMSEVNDTALAYLGLTRDELADRIARHAAGERWL